MDQSSFNPNLREAMDACRIGGRDLGLPAMSELAEAIERDPAVRETFGRYQQLDAAIGKAFHQVPVPLGLEARLLAAVAQNDPDLGVDTELSPSRKSGAHRLLEKVISTDAPQHAAVSPRPIVGKRGWRWLVIGSSAAVVFVVAAYATVIALRPAEPISIDEVVADALNWTRLSQDQEWNRDLPSAPQEKYPLDHSVLGTAQQWQRIATDFDRRAVVYDLTPPGKSRVLQFAVRTNAEFALPAVLPMTPHSTTEGLCIGVCYRDGVLYVLVVEGDEHRYRSFVKDRLPVV